MRLIIKKTEHEVDVACAMQVAAQVTLKPNSTIGLATGNTTIGIHDEMVRAHTDFGVDYSRVKTCNLDEYVGLDAKLPSSCRYRINKGLLERINIKMENTYVPNGLTEPIENEMKTFAETVERFGGIDLQVLSIGSNGHIAFNEPGTPFESGIHLAPISQSTVKAKAELFGGEQNVPKYGISVGLRDIMMMKKILLVAKGKDKADAIFKTLAGPITTDVPSSELQLHRDLIVIIDEAAASLLPAEIKALAE